MRNMAHLLGYSDQASDRIAATATLAAAVLDVGSLLPLQQPRHAAAL
jgi:hypothetical protein